MKVSEYTVRRIREDAIASSVDGCGFQIYATGYLKVCMYNATTPLP